MIWIWIRGLIGSRQGRLFGAMAGVGITVGLIVAIGTFTASASRGMTARAIAGVPVDWQIEFLPGADRAAILADLNQAAHPTASAMVGYAAVAGFKATTGQTEQSTGVGKVLGLPPNYLQTFPNQIRLLVGTWNGALLAQQTAANLHVGVGDVVSIERSGLAPVKVEVAGIVSLPNADSMFQVIGLPKGAAPQAPPDNVALLPVAQWHAVFDPLQAIRPDLVRLQLHVRLPHADLAGDPGSAWQQVTRSANNFEARVAGSAVIGDNLGARLAGAQADSLYARVLFLFLGVPGVMLAGLFTLAVANSGTERRLREEALLRTRGASVRQLLGLASLEALVISTGGMAIGAALAVVAALAWWNISVLASSLAWALVAMVVGLLLAAIGIMVPSWRAAQQQTVTSSRISSMRAGSALWQKLFIDIVLLVLAAAVFWLVARTGYQIVIAPEGVPQTAVHYDAFIAPLALWIGAGLLIIRLVHLMLERGRPRLTRLLLPIAGRLSPVVAAALSRQRHLMGRGVALVALAFAFAVSTAVFDTTYEAQALVDAQLTNGADVTATGNTLQPAGSYLQQLAALPGVTAAVPMMHRYAYVGTDLQDLYGIDPARIAQATPMSDAYFAGITARQALARLAAQPDGVLVSEETVQTFQLQTGDQLKLRLQSAADNKYHVVPFRYIGIAREFPTAPKDSFLVANASYVARMTGNDAHEIVLMRTSGNPAAVAAAARKLLVSRPGIQITTLGEAQRLIGSSLTSVDLRGLTTLELGFAVLMIAGVTGLVFLLGLAERRRSFTILAALGATPSQLGAFLWSEALLMVGAGAVGGAVIGLTVAEMLVKLLSGVFDPPPEALSIPWTYLGVVAFAAAACAAAAVLIMRAIALKPDPMALRQG
ncbi:MAG: ABC transporter permease [Alphaproteobacteria bacterium]|nr:ABC transporter permease [Alphaproteobacteria bacterium]